MSDHADRLDIIHVIQQVARAFDKKLHESLLPECFTDDAQITYYLRGHTIDFSMPDGIAGFKRYHDLCFWTQHLVSPHITALDGDTATASTPVHAVHVQVRDDDTRSHWLIAATYRDELVRTGAGWRIGRRTVP